MKLTRTELCRKLLRKLPNHSTSGWRMYSATPLGSLFLFAAATALAVARYHYRHDPSSGSHFTVEKKKSGMPFEEVRKSLGLNQFHKLHHMRVKFELLILKI